MSKPVAFRFDDETATLFDDVHHMLQAVSRGKVKQIDVIRESLLALRRELSEPIASPPHDKPIRQDIPVTRPPASKPGMAQPKRPIPSIVGRRDE